MPIVKINKQKDVTPMPNWIADERLYLSLDKTRVLTDAEFKAQGGSATLLCGIGATVTEANCRLYRLGPYALVADAANPDNVVSNADPVDPPVEQPATPEAEGPEIEPQSKSEGPADSPIPDTVPETETEAPRRRK